MGGRAVNRANAACAGKPTELWFPTGNIPDWKPARAICAVCPIADDCLAFAMETREQHGMWGGRSPHERVQMRRAAAQTAVREVAETRLSLGAAAAHLGISTNALTLAVSKGRGPAHIAVRRFHGKGHARWFTVEDLDSWAAERLTSSSLTS